MVHEIKSCLIREFFFKHSINLLQFQKLNSKPQDLPGQVKTCHNLKSPEDVKADARNPSLYKKFLRKSVLTCERL